VPVARAVTPVGPSPGDDTLLASGPGPAGPGRPVVITGPAGIMARIGSSLEVADPAPQAAASVRGLVAATVTESEPDRVGPTVTP
jgi:hypothetical protein